MIRTDVEEPHGFRHVTIAVGDLVLLAHGAKLAFLGRASPNWSREAGLENSFVKEGPRPASRGTGWLCRPQIGETRKSFDYGPLFRGEPVSAGVIRLAKKQSLSPRC